MKEIELVPKAEEDLEEGFRQFGVIQADEYFGRIAAVFDVLATYDIGIRRPELGEDIFSQPVVQHMIYFVPLHYVITIIRILSQSQDTTKHDPWR